MRTVGRHAYISCLAISLAVCAARPARGQSGVWVARAPMPAPRVGPVACGIGEILYVAGGYNNASGFLGTLLAYDPKTDTWGTKASLPTPRYGAACAAVDGTMYVMGGESTTGTVATVEAYNPITDSWTTRAPMPTSRTGLAAAALDGLIYAIGGINGSGYLPTLEAYDPRTDTWTKKAPMPTPRGVLAAGALGGLLYATGGIRPLVATQLPNLETYDPKTDTWTEEAPMPTARANLAAATAGGMFYAIGGSIASGDDVAQATVEAYDPKTGAWHTEPALTTQRESLAAGTVRDTIYAVGGFNLNLPDLWLSVNEAFTPFEMVSIDIKPGDPTNTINLRSNGVIPVAILGSATFDPMTVDPSTVTFAGARVASRGRGVPMTGQSDVNNDGYPDLLLYFRTQDLTGLEPAQNPDTSAGHRPALQPTIQTVEAVLYGTTYSGQRIRGSDAVRIVPPSNASPHALPANPRGAVAGHRPALQPRFIPRGRGSRD
jgi:N-acetylneuraminic acid mutarotase